VVASGDKAAGADVVRSMAERAGAKITEAGGSHVIMVSRPQVVAEAILTVLEAAPRRRYYPTVGKDNVEALVYVGRSPPDEGEKLGGLATRFPGTMRRSQDRENRR
jgi:hypothetical protein